MTVQKYHNFALDTHNGNSRDGFFVSNTNITEDYFFISRGDSGTSIQTLPGLQYQTTQTLMYFRTRVLGALRIPLSFLGYEQNGTSRANLASQVLMFAKAIQSVQRIVIKQLQKIAVIHLYAQGYRNEDIVNFELQLTNPSVIYEQEKIALWQSKINLAANIKDLQLLSSDWIYQNIFRISNDQKLQQRIGVLHDKRRQWIYQQVRSNGILQLNGTQPGDQFGGMEDLDNNQEDLTSLPQQSIDYGVKSKTNHLGFPQDDDLFGIKDLKSLYKIEKPGKSKKKKKRQHSVLTQGQVKKLKGFLKAAKKTNAVIKYNIISG